MISAGKVWGRRRTACPAGVIGTGSDTIQRPRPRSRPDFALRRCAVSVVGQRVLSAACECSGVGPVGVGHLSAANPVAIPREGG
jgi:hypothetical protein